MQAEQTDHRLMKWKKHNFKQLVYQCIESQWRLCNVTNKSMSICSLQRERPGFEWPNMRRNVIRIYKQVSRLLCAGLMDGLVEFSSSILLDVTLAVLSNFEKFVEKKISLYIWENTDYCLLFWTCSTLQTERNHSTKNQGEFDSREQNFDEGWTLNLEPR